MSAVNPPADPPDEAVLQQMLAAADPNVLRLALYQLTGDPSLKAMRTEKLPIWAGALFTYVLAPEHHDEVRRRTAEFLTNSDRRAPAPSRALVRETMELFGHGPMPDKDFDFAYEESAWDAFPRDVAWAERPPAKKLGRYKVLVIGAGISGLAAAVQLQRLGIPYDVVERQDDLGGTWHLNQYPDVRVDSTSLIYQYKFEKKYPWKEFFASGSETKKYLAHIADKFGVRSQIEFRTEVSGAVWDERSSTWQVSVRRADGTESTRSYPFIISANGLFSTPKLPDIPGIERFAGEVVHTTAWKRELALKDRRVALIGTGATGVQLMPHLARSSKHLTVFQRTANWILPMEGYKATLPDEMHWLFEHLPYYWNWFSYGMYYLNAQLEGLQGADPEWQKSGGAINERNDELRRTAEGFVRTKFAHRPELIQKILPTYPPMARRPTIDNGWYDALLQENVDLVTCGIQKIVPDGIIDADGVKHPCDLIVCAAGFSTMKYYWPVQYAGRDGASLDQLWADDGPRAYLGLTLPGFPNLFTPFGPNSQGRSGSFYSMAEMWARYAIKAIVHVIESGRSSIEVTREAYDDYNRLIDEEAKKLLWESHGKGFYYVTSEGRSVVNTPWSGPDIRALLFSPDYSAFTVR